MQKLNKNSFILIAKCFEKKMVAVCHFVKKKHLDPDLFLMMGRIRIRLIKGLILDLMIKN